jgi:hypothetical protein
MFDRFRLSSLVAAVLLAGACAAAADGPADEAAAGLEPLKVRYPDGSWIDWGGGTIHAVGKGYPPADAARPDAEKLAARAAELTARRRALELALGMRLDAAETVEAFGKGVLRVEIEGLIRGAEVVSTKWEADAERPHSTVEIDVPVWGLGSVQAGVWKGSKKVYEKKLAQVKRVALVEPAPAGQVRAVAVVIDTRGSIVRPALMPSITAGAEAVLYDVMSLPAAERGRRAVCRYYTTDKSIQDISRALGGPVLHWAGGGLRVVGEGPPLASLDPATAYLAAAEAEPEEPATEPIKPRRRRRRIVIKATEVEGKAPANMVISKADAKKLAENQEASRLFKEGKVMVIADSRVGGVEGRLPAPAAGDIELADAGRETPRSAH